MNEAETLGLVVMAEDRDVFAVMANYTLQEMRYIRTGPKTMLETVELEMLRRASLSVRDRVVEALLRKGDEGTKGRRRASIGASLIHRALKSAIACSRVAAYPRL